MVTSMAQGRRTAAQQRNRLARLVVINIQRLSADAADPVSNRRTEDAAAIADLWFAFIEFAPIEDIATVHGQVGDVVVAAMGLLRDEDPTAWANVVANRPRRGESRG